MTKIGHADGGDGGDTGSEKQNWLLKVSLLITSAVLISTIVASAFPDWLVLNLYIQPFNIYNYIQIGMFYACDDLYGCNDPDTTPEEWQKTASGLYAVGIAFIAFTIVAMVINVAKRSVPWFRKVQYASIVCCIFACGFSIAAIGIQYANKDDVGGLALDIGWALILASVNAGLLVLCCVLLILQVAI